MKKNEVITTILDLYEEIDGLKAQLARVAPVYCGTETSFKKFQPKVEELGRFALANQVVSDYVSGNWYEKYNTIENGKILPYEKWLNKIHNLGKIFSDTLYLEEFNENELIGYFEDYFRATYQEKVEFDAKKLEDKKGDK